MQQKSLFTYWTESFTKHYADFSGRARRSEYWGTVLFNGLVHLAFRILLIVGIMLEAKEVTFLLLICLGVYSLAWLLPGIAVSVRRLHDIGKSGWNLLWVLLPIVGAIMLIYWCCQDSQPEENKWGANPKFVNPE